MDEQDLTPKHVDEALFEALDAADQHFQESGEDPYRAHQVEFNLDPMPADFSVDFEAGTMHFTRGLKPSDRHALALGVIGIPERLVMVLKDSTHGDAAYVFHTPGKAEIVNLYANAQDGCSTVVMIDLVVEFDAVELLCAPDAPAEEGE